MPSIYTLDFSGNLLQRGFWLYVWEITTPNHELIYYVGRTGDSSSCNAQSPFNRMGQHLGFNVKSKVLRRRLVSKGVDPETCIFRLIAHGPILKEASTLEKHRQPRDTIAALESALAVALNEVGYAVINTINCRASLDHKLFESVLTSFETELPRLSQRKRT